MSIRIALLLVLVPILAAVTSVPAQSAEPASPVGRWKTIDDETNTERSIVEIVQVGDELQGRILKIFPRPGEAPDPVCQACEGERKDQPIIGMTFLWGLKRDGEDWVSGTILDPKNGKTYNAKASLTEGGRKLRVRGFLGTPLLGRTQIWLREPG